MEATEVRRVAAPVRAEAVRLLREAITRGELQPGARLGEAEMIARLGVSRTTVREAFRQLESERLIEAVPGKGHIVASVSLAQASDLYAVREVIECFAVQLFASSCTASDLAELEKAHEDLLTAYVSDNVDEILRLKDAFYAIVYHGARNAPLEEIARQLSARVARFRYASLSIAERREEGPKELRAMLDAIRRKDVDQAIALCRVHVRNAGRAAMASLSSQQH